jgi:hypothetical protein
LITLSVCLDKSNACSPSSRRTSHFGLPDSSHVLFFFYEDTSFTRKEGVPKYVAQALIKYLMVQETAIRSYRRKRGGFEMKPGTVGDTFGLILPGITSILPWLTPLAAAGLLIVMIGAVIYHLMRQETSNAISSGVIVLLLLFLVSMRWLVLPLP